MRLSLNPISKTVIALAVAAVAVLLIVPHAPAAADAGPQQQICGSVDLASSSSADAARAFDCFNTAFTRCAAAALVVTGQDAGAPVRWTFVTVDGGDDHGCSVSETVERKTDGAQTTDANLCRTVTRDKDGLRFSACSDQKDVALRVGSPAGAAAPQPQTSRT